MFLQDPYWNKITCTDAFQWKTYCFQEIVILKQQNAKSVTDASIWVMIISKNRARKSRTTLQNKVRIKVLPEQLTLFVNTSVTFKKCIIQ